jgi:membrane fusion protein, multidrug efflux system
MWNLSMKWLVPAVVLLAGAPTVAQPAPIGDQTFDCLMNAAARVKLGAQIAGVLRHVNVDRGDRVTAGQAVAQLASEVEEAVAALAKVRAENDTIVGANRAKLEVATKKLSRITRLRATGASSEKDFDEATGEFNVAQLTLSDSLFNLKAAQAEFARAQEQVAQRRIISPIDGVVVERHMFPGEYVTDQSQILSLARIDILHVEVYVPVAYYGQVVPGKQATVLPDAPVGGQYVAEVMIVDQVIDSSSGTFGVRLRLDNTARKLPAGLRCRIKFDGPAVK